jgi:hypothetical protein
MQQESDAQDVISITKPLDDASERSVGRPLLSIRKEACLYKKSLACFCLYFFVYVALFCTFVPYRGEHHEKRAECITPHDYLPTSTFAQVLNHRFVHDEVYVYVLDGCKKGERVSLSVLFQALSTKWNRTYPSLSHLSVPKYGFVVDAYEACCFYPYDGMTGGVADRCRVAASPAVYPYRFLFPLSHYQRYNELIVENDRIRFLAAFSYDRNVTAPYFLDVYNLTHPFSVW